MNDLRRGQKYDAATGQKPGAVSTNVRSLQAERQTEVPRRMVSMEKRQDIRLRYVRDGEPILFPTTFTFREYATDLSDLTCLLV